MKFSSKILFVFLVISLIIGGIASEKAFAQYPKKMITMIVPFKAGGGGDRWSRVLSTKAIDYFGQPWHVVNYPGASAMVGWKELMKRRPDGYTIQYGSFTPVISALKEEKPPIDVNRIKAVCYLSPMRTILVSKGGKAWSTWDGLIAYAKKNPGKINMGGTGAFCLPAAYLFDQAGVKVTIVPYASTGDAVADFLGGHITMLMASVSTVKPLLPEKGVGVVNCSEVAIPKMHKQLMGVPSAKDLGFSGLAMPRYISIHSDTPDDIVNFISGKMGELLKDRAIKSLLKKMGEEIWYVPHAEAQKDYKKTVESIRKAVKLLK
jgi:tripartite-type tricarboxylate transporter receptor subunit TctC